MRTRLYFDLAEKEGEYSIDGKGVQWRHHAAQSGYAAAEIVFEMLAQLLGDGGVRLSGQ